MNIEKISLHSISFSNSNYWNLLVVNAKHGKKYTTTFYVPHGWTEKLADNDTILCIMDGIHINLIIGIAGQRNPNLDVDFISDYSKKDQHKIISRLSIYCDPNKKKV